MMAQVHGFLTQMDFVTPDLGLAQDPAQLAPFPVLASINAHTDRPKMLALILGPFQLGRRPRWSS